MIIWRDKHPALSVLSLISGVFQGSLCPDVAWLLRLSLSTLAHQIVPLLYNRQRKVQAFFELLDERRANSSLARGEVTYLWRPTAQRKWFSLHQRLKNIKCLLAETTRKETIILCRLHPPLSEGWTRPRPSIGAGLQAPSVSPNK